MKTFQNLSSSYWKKLDKLTDEGWNPLINKLGNRWHVNLEHESAPTPIVQFDPISGRSWSEDTPLRIHSYGMKLEIALDDAFEQIEEQKKSHESRSNTNRK